MMLRKRLARGGGLFLALLQLPGSYAGPGPEPQSSAQRQHLSAKLVSATLPQEQEQRPLCALSTVGEVYINESRAPSETTIFAGNTLRTGNGAATCTASGRGSLKVSAKTRLSFAADPRYVAVLNEGTVVMSAFGEAAKFQVRIGDFAIVPGPEAPTSSAQIERSADGSSRVTCMTGSIGVIALEGTEAIFLQPGQFVIISADGKLQQRTAAPAALPEPVPAAPGKKSHTGRNVGWISAGAGGALAAILASRSSGSPSSRSQ